MRVLRPMVVKNSGMKKVALGINSPFRFKSYPSRHAEMDALYKVRRKKDLPKEVDIIVIRINKNGELNESRPCLHCIQIMEKSTRMKIKNVYYSTREGVIQVEKLHNMKSSNKTVISSGMRKKLNL